MNTCEMYRSPEVEWRGPHISSPVDMWAVGVVVAAMAGVPFTAERPDLSLPDRWVRYLGEPPQHLGYDTPGDAAPSPTVTWPAHLVTALGGPGLVLLSDLLTYDPHKRATTADILEHWFLRDGLFPLVGVRSGGAMPDEEGMPDLFPLVGVRSDREMPDEEGTPDLPKEALDLIRTSLLLPGQLGQSIFKGERHDWSIRTWHLQRDLLLWLQRDDIFIEGTPANKLVVQLATGNEVFKTKSERNAPRCAIVDRKVRIGGYVIKSSGTSMIRLSLKHQCPLSRIVDFMTAFLKANREWLHAMETKAKTGARRLGPRRLGKTASSF